jgi:hypothetical protein
MRRGIVLLLAATASVPGCAGAARDGLPIAPHLDHDSGVKMQAALFGRLAIRNACLVVLAPDRRDRVAFTPVWDEGAEVGRDGRGIFVRDRASGAIIRPGDRVTGGGGVIANDPPPSNGRSLDRAAEVHDRAWLNRRVTPDLPPACGGVYATFHSFRVMDPGEAR